MDTALDAADPGRLLDMTDAAPVPNTPPTPPPSPSSSTTAYFPTPLPPPRFTLPRPAAALAAAFSTLDTAARPLVERYRPPPPRDLLEEETPPLLLGECADPGRRCMGSVSEKLASTAATAASAFAAAELSMRMCMPKSDTSAHRPPPPLVSLRAQQKPQRLFAAHQQHVAHVMRTASIPAPSTNPPIPSKLKSSYADGPGGRGGRTPSPSTVPPVEELVGLLLTGRAEGPPLGLLLGKAAAIDGDAVGDASVEGVAAAAVADETGEAGAAVEAGIDSTSLGRDVDDAVNAAVATADTDADTDCGTTDGNGDKDGGEVGGGVGALLPLGVAAVLALGVASALPTIAPSCTSHALGAQPILGPAGPSKSKMTSYPIMDVPACVCVQESVCIGLSSRIPSRKCLSVCVHRKCIHNSSYTIIESFDAYTDEYVCACIRTHRLKYLTSQYRPAAVIRVDGQAVRATVPHHG